MDIDFPLNSSKKAIKYLIALNVLKSYPLSVIRVEGLSRTFKRSIKEPGFKGALQNLFNRKYAQKDAVKNINFHLEEGSFTGLVGANGAGKTTLLKLCSGLLHPTHGKITVLGFTPAERDPQFLKNIGLVMGQKSQLWADLSPRDSLELFASIYDIPPETYKTRVAEYCKLFNVTQLLGVQVRRLSLGERMKFELIAALLHQPKMLFLDEPTIGLDLLAKESVRNFLKTELKKRKITVILSSHDMEDIQEVCEKLMIIAQGELKYFGSLKEFSSQDRIFKQSVLNLITDVPNNGDRPL